MSLSPAVSPAATTALSTLTHDRAAVLETHGLTKHFDIGGARWPWQKGRTVHALTDVSLAVKPGETLAVVGESGCGKSTLARCLAGLVPPTAGRFALDGDDGATLLKRDPMRFRRSVQMVFQDPYSSINPRRRIVDTVGDALRLHRIGDAVDRTDRVRELLRDVGLSDDHLQRLPHELSGGQRQRVAIARALAVNPRVVICDEPVSALDVSVQAQIVNLLLDLQQKRGVAYVFISHNLALVEHIADHVAVMYLGQVVELSTRRRSRGFVHPYSRLLFDAAPRIGKPFERSAVAQDGDVPSPVDLPPGCHYASRCPHRKPRCSADMPALRAQHDRPVRCLLDLPPPDASLA